MIRVTTEVEFRVTKLATNFPWHPSAVGIADGRIGSHPQNDIK